MALICVLGSCAKMKEPEFRRIDGFGLRKIDFEKATVGFSVTYHNPNNFGLNVKEAVTEVYLDSTFLGKFNQDSDVQVIKNGEFSIPFSGAISLAKALQLNLNDLTNKTVLLRAEGSVKVGKAGIYVTKPIQYSGRHRLDEIKF